MKPMTLFDEVMCPTSQVFAIQSDFPRTWDNGIQLMDKECLQGWRDMLKGCHRVWVDESLCNADIGYKGQRINITKDFGELALPFDKMWFEWYDARLNTHLAAWCEDMNDGTGSYLIQAWIYSVRQGWAVIEDHDTLFISLDDNHQVMGISGVTRNGDYQVEMPVNSGDDKNPHTVAGMITLAYNALVAIGFMNCKNVTTERHERPQKPGKKSRRKRPEKLDYHTIVLPSPSGGGKSAGGGTTTGQKSSSRVHMVRGHFATYTAEAPLFGKLTGTWWWGWQIRGNPDNGEIQSEYTVKRPEVSA